MSNRKRIRQSTLDPKSLLFHRIVQLLEAMSDPEFDDFLLGVVFKRSVNGSVRAKEMMEGYEKEVAKEAVAGS